jgi:hypothetical protein
MTTRCCLATDSGLTRADQPQNRSTAYMCLHFARGDCHLGAECSFFHRTPDAEFEARLQTSKDCFGRDRHAGDRDDKGGVGGILKDTLTQRTLYVGGLPSTRTNEVSVRRYFGGKCRMVVRKPRGRQSSGAGTGTDGCAAQNGAIWSEYTSCGASASCLSCTGSAPRLSLQKRPWIASRWPMTMTGV